MKNPKLDNYLYELGWLANSEYRQDTLMGAIENYTMLLAEMSDYIHDELINKKVPIGTIKKETRRIFKGKVQALHKKVKSKWKANIFRSLNDDPKATVTSSFNILLDLMIEAEKNGNKRIYYVSIC